MARRSELLMFIGRDLPGGIRTKKLS